MLRISPVLALMAVTLAAYTAPAAGQDAPRSGPHMIVVKLVERGGSVPYAFEPGNIDVSQGDTVRFVQAANAPHNVRFTKTAPGAKLGRAATGPYLVKKDQTYDLVIDSRFTNGTYAYVCDPHEMIGMHGSMTVGSTALSGSK